MLTRDLNKMMKNPKKTEQKPNVYLYIFKFIHTHTIHSIYANFVWLKLICVEIRSW